jgi:hypothetical protein
LINPEIIIKFFECNFNLNEFFNKYETLLREYSIQNFVSSSPKSTVVIEIKKMITLFNLLSAKKIIIHADFPQNNLVEIFKPYVLLYLTSCYSLTPLIKNKAYNKLNAKLFRFQKFNPHFGRKITKTTVIQKTVFNKKIRKQQYEYNNTHVNFNEKQKDNFLQDHTTVNTNSFENYTTPNALNSHFIYTNRQNIALILNENITAADDADNADNDDDTGDTGDDDTDNDEEEDDVMPSPVENSEEEEEEEVTIWAEVHYDNFDNGSIS